MQEFQDQGDMNDKKSATNSERSRVSYGYSRLERIFGMAVCICFIGFLIYYWLSAGFSYLTRERDLSLENYHKYCTIDVVPDRAINPQNFVLRVTAKEREISDLRVQVAIYGWRTSTSDGPIMTVVLNADLLPNESAEEPFFLAGTTLDNSYSTFRVVVVRGGLA